MVTQLLGAGEYDLQIAAYWYRPYLMKKQGAPSEMAKSIKSFAAFRWGARLTTLIGCVATIAGSNAIQSTEGQRIFVQRGRESAKPGLKPEGYPGHLKVFPSRVQLAEKLEEYSRRYRELFVR